MHRWLFVLWFGCADVRTGEDPETRIAKTASETSVAPFSLTAATLDFDQDGHLAVVDGGDDCDDADRNTYPGAPEVCDGKANACQTNWDESDENGVVTLFSTAYQGVPYLAPVDYTAAMSSGTIGAPASVSVPLSVGHRQELRFCDGLYPVQLSAVMPNDWEITSLRGSSNTILDASGGTGPVILTRPTYYLNDEDNWFNLGLAMWVEASGLTIQGGGAGGLWMQDWGVFEGGLNGSDLVVRDNHGTGIRASQMHLKRSWVTDNVSATGGGGLSGDWITVNRSTIARNQGTVGGGIFASTVSLRAVQILDNAATTQGGGVYTQSRCSSSAMSVNIEGNSAEEGGGWYANSTVAITESAFIGNDAVRGGGFYGRSGETSCSDTWGATGFYSFVGVLVAENTAAEGAGVYLKGRTIQGTYGSYVHDVKFTCAPSTSRVPTRFQGNVAESGGAAWLSLTTLSSVSCDWGADDFDNGPVDLQTAAGVFDYEGEKVLTCSPQGLCG